MADNVELELGKSKYEVAHNMAREILFTHEKKQTPTRQEFLQAVYECMRILNGSAPVK